MNDCDGKKEREKSERKASCFANQRTHLHRVDMITRIASSRTGSAFRLSKRIGMSIPSISLQPTPISRHFHPSSSFLSTTPSTPSNLPKANVPEWSSSEASQAVQGLIQKFYPSTSNSIPSTSPLLPATSFVQTLDSNQLLLLRTLLDEMIPLNTQSSLASDPAASEEESRSILSPSEHLVYFTPLSPTSSLGKDGSDTAFNPPGDVFVRRMWAGGEMKWKSSEEGGLKVGDEIKEDTFIEEVSVKKIKNGNEMLVVWVKKEYKRRDSKSQEWSKVLLEDRRSWVYQKALANNSTASPTKRSGSVSGSNSSTLADEPPRSDQLPAFFDKDLTSNATSSDLLQSPTHLFRYSALTYNAHAIHLCPIWAKEKEGHPERVVHGPLNLNLILRQFRKRYGNEREVRGVEYRARNPVYVGEEYQVRLKDGNEKESEDGMKVQELEVVKKAGGKEVLIMESKVFSICI